MHRKTNPPQRHRIETAAGAAEAIRPDMATVKELIEQAGGTAKNAVEAAKTRYVEQVRGILRDLTRLKFTDRQGVEAQHTSVPIKGIVL